MNRSHGIVLRSLRYNDTQVIVSIFTELSGTVDFIVRHSPKARSGTKAIAWAPLSLIDVIWEPRLGTSIQRPKELSLWKPWLSIPFHPAKSAVTLFLGEVLSHTLRHEQANQQLFEFLITNMLWLDESDEHYANFHIIFLLKLTRFLGFMPNVEDWHEGALFDLESATFVDIVPQHPYYLDATESALVPKFLRMNIRSMQAVGLNGKMRRRALEIVTLFYRLHIPELPELKSLAVLVDVFA